MLCTDDKPVRQFVHHSYIWLGSARAVLSIFAALVIAVASQVIEGSFEPALGASVADVLVAGLIAAVTLIAATAVIAGCRVLSYRNLFYTITDDEFSLYSGIINKKCVHVPYYRIQSVDQQASLLQRIFGICTVAVDTAGGSSNKAVTVPYLTKERAESLRAELFARKAIGSRPELAGLDISDLLSQMEGTSSPSCDGGGENVLDCGARFWDKVGGVFAGQHVDTGRIAYEYGLSNKELLLAGLSNGVAFPVVVSGLLFLVGQVAQMLFGVSITRLFLSDASTVLTLRSVSVSFFAFIAGCVFFSLLLAWLISLMGDCIGYGGFRGRRRDSRVEVERGLLQHTFQGVDVDRVQAVVIKQGFLRRLFGYCELSLAKVDVMSEGSESRGSNAGAHNGMVVIHPFVKVDRVPAILEGVLPEYQRLSDGIVPMPPIALRRVITRKCILAGSGFWLAVVTSLFLLVASIVLDPSRVDAAAVLSLSKQLAFALYAFSVILFAFQLGGSVLWFRDSGFSCDGRFMQLVGGGYSKVTYIVPRQKIQYGTLRSNPFQRRSRVVTLKVRTAAGIGGTTMRLVDVALDEAKAWMDWLEPKVRS